MEEEWKVIEGFKDYQISNLGRVKSFKKYRGAKERILKYDKDGYLHINLYKNGKIKTFTVHRLVLKTFKPIDNPELFECNHIGGNKENNHVDNLERYTTSENEIHVYRIGLKIGLKGINHPNCKLTEKQILEIKALLKEGVLS